MQLPVVPAVSYRFFSMLSKDSRAFAFFPVRVSKLDVGRANARVSFASHVNLVAAFMHSFQQYLRGVSTQLTIRSSGQGIREGPAVSRLHPAY